MVALFAVACGGDGGNGSRDAEPATTTRARAGGPILEFDVEIRELDGSGVSGTAEMLTVGQARESSEIVIELEDAPDGPLAVHMHSGPCNPAPSAPTHDLEPVIDGRSETTIGAAVQGLTHGHFSLAIHESDDGDSPHIACGQISGPPTDD